MTKANVALFLIAATIVITALLGQSKQPTSAQSGRFQLFNAEYTIMGLETQDKTILRIDTQTGNVDQWVAGRDKAGKILDKWMRIGDLPLPQARPN